MFEKAEKRKEGGKRNEGKKIEKRRAGFSEDPGVLNRDADDESWTRIGENALRTVLRQAVKRATSKVATILARHRDYQLHNLL
ncbi:hypothetical protein TNCV_4000341 [Trichonephila clavipes]|nr:hypothetical protein TNCV_4000341 [Trichonephila clavipes]